MKNKLYVSLLLLLFLITIASVSAGEIDAAEGLTINEEMEIDNGDMIDLNTEELNEEGNAIFTDEEELEDNNYIQSDTKEKGQLSDSNSITVEDKTFSGIQTAINEANAGDTITLDGTYVNDGSSAINVNKTLSFIGINDATLNANNFSGIFNISVDAVSFKDINFINGQSSYGGLIHAENAKDLFLNNCNFTNGKSDSSFGGAIYANANSSVFIDYCYFMKCSSRFGGAIGLYGLESTINNSFFEDNAAEDGGAIILSPDTSINVNNCIFVNNSARNNGGAIDGVLSYAGGYTSKIIKIYNSYFENNSGTLGSALYAGAKSADVINSTFINNKGYEGAINWHSVNGTIEGCNFVNNSASGCAGAINGMIGYSTLVINCSFVNNSASNYGGAISIIKGSISDCTFENNSASSYGGAIFTKSSVSVANCNFTNNSADLGGAIRSNDTVTLTNCNFTFNNVSKNGGAISSNNGEATNCNFINNSASVNGGAIACNELFSVEDSYFESNAAIGNGGAIAAMGCTVLDCTFVNNSAGGSGAAIDLGYWYDFYKKTTITNSRFINNNASSIGGAIKWAVENGTITNCNFTNNSASDSGGAIYLDANTVSVNITNCDFNNNSVTNNYLGVNRGGGAISLIGNGIYIGYSSFLSNFAKRAYGGAIFMNTSGLSDTLGGKNLLSSNGLNANSISNVLEESTFQGNQAKSGTAIYTEEEAYIIFNHFFYNAGDELDNMISGMTQDQLEALDNDFTNSRLNTSVNSTKITVSYGDNIIIPVSSVNAREVNVDIYNENNMIVYTKVVTPNGEFVVPDLSAGTYTVNLTTIVDDNFYISSSCKNTLTITKAKSSVSASAVTSYYGKTFSVSVKSNNATSIKYTIKNSTGSVVKSGTINAGQAITGLKFAPGKYTLTLTAVVDGNHTGSSASSKITVNKATANITAKALTTYYNSGKTWSITLKDKTNNKLMTKVKLALKVYTGSKYKTYYATTNSKGVATFKASTLAAGTHKVIVSYSNKNYNCKSLTSSLKINKMSLTYKVTKSTQKDGAGLHILVKNKATKKLANKIKIKLRIYTGKKYKQYTLVSAKYSNKGNGYVGFAVKGPVFSVGTHTVKILAGDNNHAGSVSSKLVLKSTVKKYGKKTIIISNGKRTVK